MAIKSAAAQDDKREVTWLEFEKLCKKLETKIRGIVRRQKLTTVYGIPVGGWFVAREVAKLLSVLDDSPQIKRTLIVDDIVDSGKTIKPFVQHGFATASLFVKEGARVRPDVWVEEVPRSCWVKFPWESSREIEDSVRRIIEYIGEDPSREGLRDTPARVVRSWKELFSGYRADPEAVIKLQAQFSDHKKYDQMVVLRDIEFFSHCEHHMMPFFGKVHIGYLPKNKVAGISKLARMVEVFSRRLQIQERMTQQIALAIEGALNPQGVGVVVEAKHLCMMARGVEKKNSWMITSAMRGNFLEDKVKEEFLRLIGRT